MSNKVKLNSIICFMLPWIQPYAFMWCSAREALVPATHTSKGEKTITTPHCIIELGPLTIFGTRPACVLRTAVI